ncbi:putative xanthine dehydrogenase subunit A [Peptococcaceae bacterium CEB3]|nr:putative xanthine dehydrogenase subunit A [Peptococcaceae bacterium CEB3]
MIMNEYYSTLLRYLEEKRPSVAAVIVRGPAQYPAGSRFIFDGDGQRMAGEQAWPALADLAEKVREVLRSRVPRLYRWEVAGEPLEVFLDPLIPAQRLLILGGGHIAVPLAQVGQMIGFEVTVVDDRPSFASMTRFPAAARVICDEFGKAIKDYALDGGTFVVIVTRGHRHDKDCLAEVLRNEAPPAYTGMIGSRRKVKAVLAELREEGISPALLDSVQAPIGLDIGGQTPEEIAVSIMAEIIMVKYYGYSTGLKVQSGGVRGGSAGNAGHS